MINKWIKTLWGTHDNKPVFLFKFKNADGSYVEITNYGAIVKSIVIPDKKSELKNVVLGFSTLEEYKKDICYIGATIGRYANRIGNASYVYNNQKVYLDKNDGSHHNHGGKCGFNAQVFDYQLKNESLILSLKSPSGAGGFPGDLTLEVHYIWNHEKELSIKYRARTTAVTPINITNHCYFNLSGTPSKIWDHILNIDAKYILETSKAYIPNGKIISSASTYPSNNLTIGENLYYSGKIIGLNHYFIGCIEDENSDNEKFICSLYEPQTGIQLKVFTSYPGVQVYTGDFLRGDTAKSAYGSFEGICLECQYFPDSPNHEHFPSTLLKPSEFYDETIVYAFGNL